MSPRNPTTRLTAQKTTADEPLNQLAGAELNIAILERDGAQLPGLDKSHSGERLKPEDMDLSLVDAQTPFVKAELNRQLSTNERKILSSMARATTGAPMGAFEIAEASRVGKEQIGTYLTRLVKKGFLVRSGRGQYIFKSEAVLTHLIARRDPYLTE